MLLGFYSQAMLAGPVCDFELVHGDHLPPVTHLQARVHVKCVEPDEVVIEPLVHVHQQWVQCYEVRNIQSCLALLSAVST